MPYKYSIPAIPPSNNRFAGRQNHWEYREQKKQWQDMISACCAPVPPEPIESAVVTLTYYFPTRVRRDPDNYSGKFILDGLVRKCILLDDSFKNVELVLRGDYDKSRPRTEIEVTEK